MIKFSEIENKLKTNGKYWIAFVGDSITSCEWVHPNWRDIVQYVLQKEMTNYLNGDWKIPKWGIKGFNFGYDGATTKDILEKIEDVKTVKPDLVIGLMGVNDPVLDVSVDESIKNISSFIKRLNTQVVWCSSTSASRTFKKNLEYEPYANAFIEKLNLKNLQKIDMFNMYQQFDTSKFFTFILEENQVEGISEDNPDPQHPNQLGNAYIAKIILKEVFDIKFDPEKYWKDTQNGEKYPKY